MSTFTTAPPSGRQPLLQGFYTAFRMDVDLRDCEVEGRLPADLRGRNA
jgi:carotenoid cleavage dioxygenase-like enzyme